MHSAGTVEYAYLTSGEYFFLGFTPRLHDDFPITEAISGVRPASSVSSVGSCHL
jgi:acetyl/propionyl-CoA carboxylase alpha subunit